MKESDILHQNGAFWVTKTTKGTFEVYEISTSGTHSVRRAQIGFKGDVGLQRAISECNRRDSIHKRT